MSGDADAEAAVLKLIDSLDKEGDGEGVIYETLRDSAAAAGIGDVVVAGATRPTADVIRSAVTSTM